MKINNDLVKRLLAHLEGIDGVLRWGNNISIDKPSPLKCEGLQLIAELKRRLEKTDRYDMAPVEIE